MKIVKGQLDKGTGEQTLMLEPDSGQYFVVSTNSTETLIFKSDEEGNIQNNHIEVWGTPFMGHEPIVELLVTGQLTTEYFYNMD